MTLKPPSSTDESDKASPDSRHEPDASLSARPRIRFNPLNLTLAGLPEMDYFESDEKRIAALRQIAKDAGRPNQWGYWVGVGLIWLVSMSVYFFGRYAMHFVQWPSLTEKALSFIVMLLAAVLLIRRFHRQGMQSMLRSELLKQGVPVCIKCGYLLRGLTVETGRCPECGRGFDGLVRAIITNAQVNAAEGDVSPHK